MAAGTIACVGQWVIVLVLPELQAEFGLDRGTAAMGYTFMMGGFAVGNIVLGRLVDRHGITPVLIAAAVALSAGYGLSAFATSYWQVLLLQVLVGMATAAGFGPLMADLSHWFLKRRGIAVASAACGNYIAGALWPQLLKGTIETEGWRHTFGVVAIAVIVLMVPLALSLRRRIVHDAHFAAGAVAAAPRGSQGVMPISPATLQWMLATAGFACCMAMAMPQVHLVSYCMDLGYGIVAGAEMVSIMLVGGVVSRLLSGFVADYIGGIRTLLIGSVLQCLALFLYLPFDGLTSLYVVSAIFGLAQGGIVPCYALIVREYLPAREAGKRVGIVITATVVGMAAGGWASGVIYDWTGSYQAAFLNGIAWNLLIIAIMMFLLG
ncbi:MAG: MFS transporter, partial [Nitratireductor sp.]|nr:MFS transporter [Nitratireductor sp.]